MFDELERYNIKAVGVAWYSAETWKRLEAIPEARIEKSYQDFIRSFESLVQQNTARGIKSEKIDVDLDHMIAWCHRNGYEIDSTGRAVYGSMMVMARDDPTVMDKPIIDNVTRVIQ